MQVPMAIAKLWGEVAEVTDATCVDFLNELEVFCDEQAAHVAAHLVDSLASFQKNQEKFTTMKAAHSHMGANLQMLQRDKLTAADQSLFATSQKQEAAWELSRRFKLVWERTVTLIGQFDRPQFVWWSWFFWKLIIDMIYIH